jgi:hypothetical protein
MKINRLFAIALACIGASTITSCSDQVLFPSNQHLQLVKVSGQNPKSIRPLKPAVVPSISTSFIAKETSVLALKQMPIPALQIAKPSPITANASKAISYSKSDIKIIPSELKTVIKKSNQLKKQLGPNDGDPTLRGIGWVFIILGILITLVVSILVGLLMMLVGLLFVNSGKPR